MTRRKSIAIRVLLALMIVGGYFGLASLIAPPAETTQIGEYPGTLAQWKGTHLVSHFPATFSTNSQSVRFAAFPGFLQGGSYIQLALKLPAVEIQAIEQQLKQSAKHTYVGGGFFDHYNRDQRNNVPTTTFRTSGSPGVSEFPPHFTVYVHSALDGGGAWNHGKTSGTAISTKTNEVVYWADSW